MPRMTMVEAINDALSIEMDQDDRVIVLGDDVGELGGLFGATRGLAQRFGGERVVDLPPSENAIVGAALGLAMHGLKPVAEIPLASFMAEAFDQIASEVARHRLPCVIRAPVGPTPGPASSAWQESPDSLFAGAGGLKVVYPSGPYDAKGLLISAIRGQEPVIFFEPQLVYRGAREEVPAGAYEVRIGEAKVAREGADLTVLAWGAIFPEAVRAVNAAVAGDGLDCELIDLRTLSPLDVNAIVRSVAKTGRLVVVEETLAACGVGAEIVARVHERAFYHLEAPPLRVAAGGTGGDTILEAIRATTEALA